MLSYKYEKSGLSWKKKNHSLKLSLVTIKKNFNLIFLNVIITNIIKVPEFDIIILFSFYENVFYLN